MNKWLKDNIMSTLTLAAIVGGVFYFSNIQQLFFSSPQIKYKTETHVENTDDLTVFKNRQKDSVIESEYRRVQDSLNRERDTLQKRNAVTTYQNKQRLDSVTILLKQMKESLDHTLEHVEH